MHRDRFSAARLEHREGLLRGVTADGIENSIATPHDLREILPRQYIV